MSASHVARIDQRVRACAYCQNIGGDCTIPEGDLTCHECGMGPAVDHGYCCARAYALTEGYDVGFAAGFLAAQHASGGEAL